MLTSRAAGGTKTVQNRSSAQNLKAVLLQKMSEKFSGGVAIQMLYLSATDAFFVKMLVTVAFFAHVLKDVAVIFGVAEFSNGLLFAQIRKLAIDAAFSAF